MITNGPIRAEQANWNSSVIGWQITVQASTEDCTVVADRFYCRSVHWRYLNARTTWFHQSQIYQPTCTNLICTELICTKPHFYHPPKMVARTRESSPSRATRAQGRRPSWGASPLTPLAAFFYCFWPLGKFKVWYRWAWYRWAAVKPRSCKDEVCGRWGSTEKKK